MANRFCYTDSSGQWFKSWDYFVPYSYAKALRDADMPQLVNNSLNLDVMGNESFDGSPLNKEKLAVQFRQKYGQDVLYEFRAYVNLH